MKRILAWLEARLSLRDSVGPMLMHPIPRAAAGPMGWWYVFGSASMTLLMIQILSGIGLSLVYVPTADQAYESLVYLNEQQPLGWFLRSLHYWSGSAMVVMVVAHMTQVFLQAAHKRLAEARGVPLGMPSARPSELPHCGPQGGGLAGTRTSRASRRTAPSAPRRMPSFCWLNAWRR